MSVSILACFSFKEINVTVEQTLWDVDIEAFEKNNPDKSVKASLTQTDAPGIPSCAELEVQELSGGEGEHQEWKSRDLLSL